MWGYITPSEIGEMTPISAHMNSAEYVEILSQVYIPSMQTTFGSESNNFIFMQDNAPMHKSRETQEWFRSHPEIKILRNWPPYSPDLNPIENLWAKLVYEWPEENFVNKQQILNEITKRWESIRGTDFVNRLYGSMQNRMREVIQADGNWCRY